MHKDFLMAECWLGPSGHNHGRRREGWRTLRSMAWLETTRAESTRVGVKMRSLLAAPTRPAGSLRRVAETYGLALAAVAACTAIALAVNPYALLEDEEMIYLLGVLMVSLRFDVKVSI